MKQFRVFEGEGIALKPFWRDAAGPSCEGVFDLARKSRVVFHAAKVEAPGLQQPFEIAVQRSSCNQRTSGREVFEGLSRNGTSSRVVVVLENDQRVALRHGLGHLFVRHAPPELPRFWREGAFQFALNGRIKRPVQDQLDAAF